MVRGSIEQALAALTSRAYAGGGFLSLPGGAPRADAACWAILALGAAGGRADLVQAARRSLAGAQRADGAVCISSQHPQACWPTPLTVLAWQGAPEHEQARKRAVEFLTGFDQITVPPEDFQGTGTDDTIRGWPWIADAYPWVEPTACTLMALRMSGHGEHARARDGVRLLLDRQISSGGWNYGNTTILGQKLHPMPETTGMALEALAGLAPRATVEGSMLYAESQGEHLLAPMSFAWCALGLAAWGEIMESRQERILHILGRQEDYGPYDTVSLSLLLLAWYCDAGLLAFLRAGTGKGDS